MDDSDEFWQDIDELIRRENVATVTTATTETTTTTTITTTASITTTTTATSDFAAANVNLASNYDDSTEVRQIADYLEHGDFKNWSSDYSSAPDFERDEKEKEEEEEKNASKLSTQQ